MAKKNIADKYWIYGEDAELAAPYKLFDKSGIQSASKLYPRTNED